MENKKGKKIDIKLIEEKIISLSSDTPDIDELIDNIVLLRGEIDLEKIEVSSNSDDFDNEGFKEVVVSTIKTFIEKIELNSEEAQNVINALNKQNKDEEIEVE